MGLKLMGQDNHLSSRANNILEEKDRINLARQSLLLVAKKGLPKGTD